MQDRVWRFKKWHREAIPRDCYAVDADLIEYRFISDELAPVALLELKRIDTARPPAPLYFQRILERTLKRDGDGAALKRIAEMLCCDAYLVCFAHPSLLIFWVYNLSTGHGWVEMDAVEYTEWTKNMKAVKRFDPDYVPPWFY
jgi:hypothetical protein